MCFIFYVDTVQLRHEGTGNRQEDVPSQHLAIPAFRSLLGILLGLFLHLVSYTSPI